MGQIKNIKLHIVTDIKVNNIGKFVLAVSRCHEVHPVWDTAMYPTDHRIWNAL